MSREDEEEIRERLKRLRRKDWKDAEPETAGPKKRRKKKKRRASEL